MERRSTARFPLRQQVCFRPLDFPGIEPDRYGTTVDFSSGGMCFETDAPLAVGRIVEVSVDWPVALGGTCPLKFVAVGRVVRTGRFMTAVKIEKYQFRTRGKAAEMAKAAALPRNVAVAAQPGSPGA